jgi:uncharacterized cupredoxin-like copper-binding protein
VKLFWRLGTVAALTLCLAAGVAAQEAKKPAKKPAAEKSEQAEAKKPAAKVQLPPAITEAFQKAYPNAKITGTAKETEGAKTVYEVESVDQGLNRDLIYNPDGTVVEIEEAMKPADLPAPVSDALKKLYPKAKITKAEKLTRGETVEYEMALSGAPKTEVAFMPDGKLVPPEKPEPKKPAAKKAPKK